MVDIGVYVDTSISMKRPSLHAIGSKTAKRYTAPEPVFTRYKLLAATRWLKGGKHFQASRKALVTFPRAR